MSPIPATARRARRICLCVDDFGWSQGVNAAALALIEMGRVHAIGCMVGAPAWSACHQRVYELAEDSVDIGLHLDLTQFPLIPQTRRPLSRWILASYAGCLPRETLRAEIQAQCDVFESRWMRAPAFVDGHQHVHQLPGVREILIEELLRRHGAVRPWLRSTRVLRGLSPSAHGGWAELAKAQVIASLGGRGLARLAHLNGFLQNDRLAGVYGFDADRQRYLALLSAGLQRCVDGTLVMCHPSLCPGGEDAIEEARLVEFEVLRSLAFGHLLVAGGFELQPMSRLLGTRPRSAPKPVGRRGGPS